MKRRWLVAAVAAWAQCGPAWAAQANFSEPYVELGLGVATGSDLAFDGVKASLDWGPAASLGFGFARLIGAVDLRLDFATTDRDTCFLDCALGNQGVTSRSIMLSALYNIPIVQDRMDAYLGAGAGRVGLDVQHTGGNFSASNNYSGSAAVFGWQFLGGARVKLFGGPIHLYLEYRYQSASDARVEGHTVEYSSNSFMAGARWAF